eukprot:TRINITY_DN12428_c0_g1_i3.p1 TRINITY_DN12428_c0_g1~~TRINITY_DN12428_c0_g1_i3.p1  ORF type:complete len:188 (-),score=25.14 TRINITY_DN12428_c0_g1_i3:348-911(-)
MLAWMGGSRKKLKEAKNRGFGGGNQQTSQKFRKRNKVRHVSPNKLSRITLQSTPVKERFQEITQIKERQRNGVGPSRAFFPTNSDDENVGNDRKNLHSEQFELLMGQIANKEEIFRQKNETSTKENKNDSVRQNSEKCTQTKTVELRPLVEGSLDLLAITMEPEGSDGFNEEEVVLLESELMLEIDT